MMLSADLTCGRQSAELLPTTAGQSATGAPYLGAAIRSILSQTETALTVMVIDDGSRDSSMIIAKSFKDSRVKVIEDGSPHDFALHCAYSAWDDVDGRRPGSWSTYDI